MHPQKSVGKSQVRTRNAKRRRYYPVNPPPMEAVDTAADQIIGDARKPYMLHALHVMNRRRYGIGFLFDDDEGHELFVAMCSLGLREKEWPRVAPWLKLKSKPEREAFEQRIALFTPTLRNISVAARFTRADRAKYAHEVRIVGNKIKRSMQALLQLPLIDANLEEVLRDERNAARRKRWLKDHAAAVGMSVDPREIAVIEAVMRIARQPGAWHDYSVPNIIRSIERYDRALFPHSHSSFRRIVYRLIKRLVDRGRLLPDLRLSGAPDSSEKLVTPCDAGSTPSPSPTPAKSLKSLDLAVTLHSPEPRILGDAMSETTTTDALRGGTTGLGDVEAGSSSAPPDQPTSHPVRGGHHRDQHVDGMSIINHVKAAATSTKEEDDMRMTDEERLELAYLRQRLTALEKKVGVRAGDPPPQPPVEPVTGDHRIEPSHRTVQ